MDFNKLQYETKEIIKKEIYELKKTAQDTNKDYKKRYGKSQKKESNRKTGNKKSLK
jgi:hypothetical protein